MENALKALSCMSIFSVCVQVSTFEGSVSMYVCMCFFLCFFIRLWLFCIPVPFPLFQLRVLFSVFWFVGIVKLLYQMCVSCFKFVYPCRSTQLYKLMVLRHGLAKLTALLLIFCPTILSSWWHFLLEASSFRHLNGSSRQETLPYVF